MEKPTVYGNEVFQFVEVIGAQYKQENEDCDLWNLYDEKFERWLKEKTKKR